MVVVNFFVTTFNFNKKKGIVRLKITIFMNSFFFWWGNGEGLIEDKWVFSSLNLIGYISRFQDA